MSEVCERLHGLVHGLETHAHPIERERVPANGIYLVLEEGERGHGGDRIVRIGTHTGERQLRARLRQHFIQENKDRSIFRKNIGRALLASEDDAYLKVWNLDLTSRAARERHGHRVDPERQEEIERRVTRYIQRHLRVVPLEVERKEGRLRLESRLVSTVSLCEACRPSPEWLGRHSPKRKIRESGLWQVNELYKQPLSLLDVESLEGMVRNDSL